MHFAQVSQCPSRCQSTQKAPQNFSLISIQHKSVPCWLNGPFYTWHWDTWLLTRDCDERGGRMGNLKTTPPLLRVVSIVKFELCQQGHIFVCLNTLPLIAFFQLWHRGTFSAGSDSKTKDWFFFLMRRTSTKQICQACFRMSALGESSWRKT